MNIFAFLNKSSNRAGRSGTAMVAELTERNRRFEAFLLEKLADLESKIIPADPMPLPDEGIPEKQPDTPDEAATWDEADALLTSKLLGAQPPAAETVTETTPVETSAAPNWLAGFDDPPTDTAASDPIPADDDNIDEPPDVDEALPATGGEKGDWA